jgi:hypothetical protein
MILCLLANVIVVRFLVNLLLFAFGEKKFPAAEVRAWRLVPPRENFV